MNKKKLTTKETFALAVQNQQKNNLQVAENLYKEVLKTNPNHFESIFFLGTLSLQIKNFNRAIQFLNQAIQIQPNHVDSHNNLGAVFFELGKFQKAITCYQKAIQIQPNHTNAHWCLHSFAPDIDEALKILKKSYRVNNRFLKNKIMISALQGFKGNFKDFKV